MNIWRIALSLMVIAALCRAEESFKDLQSLKESPAATPPSFSLTDTADAAKTDTSTTAPLSPGSTPASFSALEATFAPTVQENTSQTTPEQKPAESQPQGQETSATPSPSPEESVKPDANAMQATTSLILSDIKNNTAVTRATKAQSQQFIKAFRKFDITAIDSAENFSELLRQYPLATQDTTSSKIIERSMRILKARDANYALPDTATLVRLEIARINLENADPSETTPAPTSETPESTPTPPEKPAETPKK